jgi:hypothetical protein
MWPPVSRSPCMTPCSFSPLLSTNKIFLNSASGVHLCFHSHSRPQNLEHMKFLSLSSVHHIWSLTKGPVFTWGWYRLGQTGKGCLGSVHDHLPLWWSLFSNEREREKVSLRGVLFSLSLLLGRFLPWEFEEKLWAHYSCKAGKLRNWELAEGLHQTANTTWVEPNFSALRLFSLNSQLPPSLNSLPFKFWPI